MSFGTGEESFKSANYVNIDQIQQGNDLYFETEEGVDRAK